MNLKAPNGVVSKSTSSTSQSSTDTGAAPTGIVAFQKSVYVITRRDCVACHATATVPLHASATLEVAYAAAKTKVNFADVAASTIVAKVKDAHCGTACQSDGSEMIRAIQTWSIAEMATPSPTPSPSPTLVPRPVVVAPTAITYGTNPASYTVGTAIVPNVATVTGGVPTAFAVNPALPSGLTLSVTNGMITGAPTSTSPKSTYTVTASNSAGSATVALSITVLTNVVAPTLLKYSNAAPVWTKGTLITPLSPSSSGGAPTLYQVSPALPAGIVINATTGIISGTPTALASATTYTITATNDGGSTTTTISAVVNDVAPATLAYTSNPASYKIATLITANTPTTTGGTPTAYTVTPNLPTGLLLNATTGIITGTPTTVTAAANYTVKAANSAGSAQVALNIAVVSNVVAPTNLVYSSMTSVLSRGLVMTALTPTSSGGAPTSYTVATALPIGLSLNATTGVISGTPSVVQAATNYVVTATNSAGSATATLSIAVSEIAPASLAYTVNPASYIVGTMITSNSPTTTGGVPTSYSVLPALPTGLLLNTTSGVISGTPTTATAQATYTVKATNTAGSAQVALVITVPTNVVAPSKLSYANLSPVFVKGTLISALSPTSQGGAPTAYSVSPALPAGLLLNPTTGVISGTPTATQVNAPFVVTGTNAGGSTTVTLAITVNDVAPTMLTYATLATVYPKGSAITANVPSNSGGAITSYAVSPALPTGLTLNATTGTVSGTPTAALLPAMFTVTGTNSGGSSNAILSIGISDLADPNATYSYIQTNLMVPKCAVCHTAGAFAGAADYTTYANLKNVVSGSNPLTSALYIRTAPGAASPMPPGSSIATVQNFAIMNWIARGSPNDVVASPTPSPTPTSTSTATYLEPTYAQFRMTNRNYVASALNQIFGPSAATPVTNIVLAKGNVSTLGGPCNGYSDMVYDPAQGAPMKPSTDCDIQASAAAATMPVGNTGREALMTRACDLILSQDATVLYAAGLVLGSTVTTATIPAMNATSISGAHDLFYQGKPIGTQVAADLQSIATGGSSALDGWRFVLLTLCYAPSWQLQ